MKINFNFLIVLIIGCIAFINDILIYLFNISYVASLAYSSMFVIFIYIFLILKKQIRITADFDKMDIFIWLVFIILILVKCSVFPDFSYDVATYHIYLQENPFIDKVNFDFFPGRIFCIFLFPLGDRMYYMFRYFLGYRLGTILSCYLIVVLYYQIKIFLTDLTGKKVISAIISYFVFGINVLTIFIGVYFIDNLGTVFLLQLILLAFKDEKSNYDLMWLSLISGIATGIKVLNAFYAIIIIAFYIKENYKKIPIKYYLLSVILFILPFIIYAIDNFIQTGNVLFPYYNAIFRSKYFGFFNWKDERFWKKNVIQFVFWPIIACLKELNYGEQLTPPKSQEFLSAFGFCMLFLHFIAFRKITKNSKIHKLAIINVCFILVWMTVMIGYLRYGIIIIVLNFIIFAYYFVIFVGDSKLLNSKLLKYLYSIAVFTTCCLGIILWNTRDIKNQKYCFIDIPSDKYTIKIDGVWGTISIDGIYENSTFPSLVREEGTPIYNLNRKSFEKSPVALEMYEERINNNKIFVIIDDYTGDLTTNERITYLKELGFEVVNIYKTYTPDEIPYMNANSVWHVAEIRKI